MRRPHDTVDAYVASIDGPQRELLDRLRELILEVAPRSHETIEHGMLAYPGLGCLAAQKRYVSLYVSPALLEKHRERLGVADCGKSCIRFKKLAELREGALRELLREAWEIRDGAS